jgi:hypothetical protein
MAAAVLAITAQLSFAADASRLARAQKNSARRLARRLEDGREVVALHRGRRQPHRPAQRQAVENLHHRRHDAGQAAPTDTVADYRALINQIQIRKRPPACRVEVKDEDGKRRPLFYSNFCRRRREEALIKN